LLGLRKLEIRRAAKGNKVSKNEVEKDLEALRGFLLEHAERGIHHED